MHPCMHSNACKCWREWKAKNVWGRLNVYVKFYVSSCFCYFDLEFNLFMSRFQCSFYYCMVVTVVFYSFFKFANLFTLAINVKFNSKFRFFFLSCYHHCRWYQYLFCLRLSHSLIVIAILLDLHLNLKLMHFFLIFIHYMILHRVCVTSLIFTGRGWKKCKEKLTEVNLSLKLFLVLYISKGIWNSKKMNSKIGYFQLN